MTGDFFPSNIGSRCRFVVQRRHGFKIPSRFKVAHTIQLYVKISDLMKIGGACHYRNISESPFKYIYYVCEVTLLAVNAHYLNFCCSLICLPVVCSLHIPYSNRIQKTLFDALSRYYYTKLWWRHSNNVLYVFDAPSEYHYRKLRWRHFNNALYYVLSETFSLFSWLYLVSWPVHSTLYWINANYTVDA